MDLITLVITITSNCFLPQVQSLANRWVNPVVRTVLENHSQGEQTLALVQMALERGFVPEVTKVKTAEGSVLIADAKCQMRQEMDKIKNLTLGIQQIRLCQGKILGISQYTAIFNPLGGQCPLAFLPAENALYFSEKDERYALDALAWNKLLTYNDEFTSAANHLITTTIPISNITLRKNTNYQQLDLNGRAQFLGKCIKDIVYIARNISFFDDFFMWLDEQKIDPTILLLALFEGETAMGTTILYDTNSGQGMAQIITPVNIGGSLISNDSQTTNSLKFFLRESTNTNHPSFTIFATNTASSILATFVILATKYKEINAHGNVISFTSLIKAYNGGGTAGYAPKIESIYNNLASLINKN